MYKIDIKDIKFMKIIQIYVSINLNFFSFNIFTLSSDFEHYENENK